MNQSPEEAMKIFQKDLVDTPYTINQQVQSNFAEYVRNSFTTTQQGINKYLDNCSNKIKKASQICNYYKQPPNNKWR